MSTSCRACKTPLATVALDLGEQPLGDALLGAEDLDRPETRLPLRLMICTRCWLLQLGPFGAPLPYAVHGHGEAFSPTAQAHLQAWADRLVRDLRLGPGSRVLDISSGQGYLLRHFQQRGITALGLEKDATTRASAFVPTRTAEFCLATARGLVDEGFRADLILVNHALAHTDDLDDFVAGLALVLAPDGAIAFEFHHVMGVVHDSQFDVVSHPHRSYVSLLALEPVLDRHGLAVVDAETIPMHGGSVNGLARWKETSSSIGPGVDAMRQREADAGLGRLESYLGIGAQAATARTDLLEFLTSARAHGRRVSGYGAPGRGTTLLNYCGITTDLLPFTVDRSPLKQSHFLPGCHIPVRSPEAVIQDRPAYLLILAWTFASEIMRQMSDVRTWRGQFVVALPRLQVFD